ncbi:MAG TPA: isoprenylcysteine carboxylmethyltransferase family protein [Vicinamibacterales bacterium]|nr:isoprenylcysteine carboxylmethyltransferase family protein [Vicinamibacterales bacterium]
MLPLISLIAILIMMLGELWLSRSNEGWMLAHGASAPPDPVYGTMRWAYPIAFVAMAAEGIVMDRPIGTPAVAGAVLLVTAKVLKFWAIASLGRRWTYKVFVLHGAPLVASGPYRFMRHPNYVAVIGELVAMALLSSARVTGPLSVIGFGVLLVRRIAAEEQALGLRARA